MSKAHPKQKGFTIVELLVVIVVIGILAAITIVSYTGISSKAIVASLQSDLTSSAQKLKMYYTEYGSYPVLDTNKCPQTPNVDNRYCLKASSSNILTYSLGANTFTLIAVNGCSWYYVNENMAPAVYTANQLFASGGTITNATCGHATHTYTFGPGTSSMSAIASGNISVSISAGGGGGGSWSANGGGGGNSYISYSSTTYQANGGQGGGGHVGGYNGNDGATNSPSGWISNTGGGGGGGDGADEGDGYNYAGNGGSGGNLTIGSFAISSGQTITIVVGGGGGPGGDNATGGGNGSIVISYSN
jgi:prepilin-type N-terminal cleavage/methylation domain-containing protein